jgi:hypothetical protein
LHEGWKVIYGNSVPYKIKIRDPVFKLMSHPV